MAAAPPAADSRAAAVTTCDTATAETTGAA